MLRDSRSIAGLYMENFGKTNLPPIQKPSQLPQAPEQPPSNVAGTERNVTPASVTNGGNVEASEEPKKVEKQLPAKHWVKVEKIVKDDVKEIENLAHELAMLVHSCSENEEVVSKVMSKIFKKHRAWTKKK